MYKSIVNSYSIEYFNDDMKFYILTLSKQERRHILNNNKKILPCLQVFNSINGFNEEETKQELKNSGLRHHNLDYNTYGSLANFLTKYKCLIEQIKQKTSYICFIEDSVQLSPDFKDFCTKLIEHFKNDSELNIIRLGFSGQGYITSFEGAKRITKLLQKTGIIKNIDNQLRLNCGKEFNASLLKVPWKFEVERNKGDCLKTTSLDEKVETLGISIDEFNLKFNSNITELPHRTVGVGIDEHKNIFVCNVKETNHHEYHLCIIEYWMKYIHKVLRKKEYYFILCHADGFKFDTIDSNIAFLATNLSMKLPPLFAFCKRWNDDNTFLIPDPYFSCKDFNLNNFKDIDQANIKWHEKENKCIWRGTKYWGHETNFFGSLENIKLNQRNYFVQLYQQGKLENVDYADQYKSISDQIKYKYILDIDGVTNTWDATLWKLYSGSVLLKVKSTWKQWYYDDFKEWVHYVPVNNDLSDLNQKIKWCQDNEQSCLKIIENARKFALQYTDNDFVIKKILPTIKSYFKITKQ
jgi:hypothetical protein